MCHLYDMEREYKATYTYASLPSIREKAKQKAEKEGYSLSVRIEMLLREYIRPKKADPVIQKWKEKAEKWDALAEKISAFYPEDESESNGDLTDIGEAAAMAFGYL